MALLVASVLLLSVLAPANRIGGQSAVSGGAAAPSRSFLPVVNRPRAGSDYMGVYMLDAGTPWLEANLAALGARWWTDFGAATAVQPDPFKMRIVVMGGGDAGTLTGIYAPGALAAAARANPGSVWELGNEVNVPAQDYQRVSGGFTLTPDEYAQRYKAVRDEIKSGDPGAVIVALNVLNWDFNCTGCGNNGAGWPTGRVYFEQFWAAHLARYGIAPAPDAWGIHVYTITWDHTPMVDAATSLTQVASFRNTLDSYGQAAAPIWITEMGVIWGWDAFVVDSSNGCTSHDGCILPFGQYQYGRVSDYFDTVNSWLYQNALGLNIRRWFWYAQAPVLEPYSTAYGGINFMTQPGANAALFAPFGPQFRTWAARG